MHGRDPGFVCLHAYAHLAVVDSQLLIARGSPTKSLVLSSKSTRISGNDNNIIEGSNLLAKVGYYYPHESDFGHLGEPYDGDVRPHFRV